MFVRQLAEAEVRIVKGVNQLAHVLDPFTQLRGVIPESRGREIIRGERFVNRVTGHNPAFEGQHDAGRKNRIKKTIRVADEQETFHTAIARVKRKLARNVIRTELLAAGEIFLD